VVKALQGYKSEGPGIDFRCSRVSFSVASDRSMCPGIDSASKYEYQVNPGGKGGRCVKLTTYHLQVPMTRNLEALTSWNPVQACNETAFNYIYCSLLLFHINARNTANPTNLQPPYHMHQFSTATNEFHNISSHFMSKS